MYLYEDLEINELIRLSRDRNEEAFAELIRRYTPLMRSRVAEHLSYGVGYDELFAEACVGLHSAAVRFDTEQDGVTFGLFARICIDNRIVDLLRKFKGQPKVSGEVSDEAEVDERSDVEEQILHRELLAELLSGARRLLSEYEYKVFMLHLQGYKTAAIAKALSRPAKSVDNAKSRLFRRLRAELGNITED